MLKMTSLALSLGALLVTPSALANIVGSGTQNFNTATSGLDFVTVQSSQTLRPGLINIGLFLNDAINSLPYFESVTQNRINFSNHLIGSDLNIGVGLLPRWEVGLSLSSVVQQAVEADQPYHGQFATNGLGLTEIRLGSKYRLSGTDRGGVAPIGSMNINVIDDNPYAGIGSSPTLNLEVAADTTFRRVRLALNLGYRWLHPGAPVPGAPILPQGDQLIASAAASYLLLSLTPSWSRSFGGRPMSTVDSTTDRATSSLELLVEPSTTSTRTSRSMAESVPKIIDGTSAPDWRLYTGLNFAFGPVFNKSSTQFQTIREDADVRLITQNITFDFNSDKLSEEAIALMEMIVAYFSSEGKFQKITVEGHTDSIGSLAYNMDLSQRRANVIRNHLISVFHYPPEQVDAVGYGPTRPVDDNGNYQGRQANRRVEFTLQK